MSIESDVQAQQAAAAMEHLNQMQALLQGQMSLHDTGTFTAKDESETVAATIDGDCLLIGLEIEEGLRRLGAETVEQRINEAIANAHTQAMAAIQGQHEQTVLAFAKMTADLAKSVGLQG